MAGKRQRKKRAKRLGFWEGEQYRGGREKEIKNYVKVDGGIVNQHGVFFSNEQRKELEKAVARSNRIRKKMLKQWDALNPVAYQQRKWGKDSDIILTRQSKSMQGFKSLEAYEAFMDKQARIQSGEHLDEMLKLYKRNYMKAVRDHLNDAGIEMRIRMMKPADFAKLVEEKGEDMEINYVYDPTSVNNRRNRIRDLLGMKSVPDEDPHYNIN